MEAALGISMVRFRKAAIRATEARVDKMGEVIRCIKTIKMHAWERPFMARIEGHLLQSFAHHSNLRVG